MMVVSRDELKAGARSCPDAARRGPERGINKGQGQPTKKNKLGGEKGRTAARRVGRQRCLGMGRARSGKVEGALTS